MKNLSKNISFDDELVIARKKAYQKFQSAAMKIRVQKGSTWFKKLSESGSINSLKQIGYDEHLLRNMFFAARPSWSCLRFRAHQNIILQPFMHKRLMDVRTGITRTDLFPVHEKFPLPWIILPRVYDHLKKNDSNTLPLYIDFLARDLNQEQNQEFKKILSHIIINYMGNYSLKFRCWQKSEQLVLDMLFYGYAAMFWKNLKQPPKGFEECTVFKSFLNWIRFLPGISSRLSRKKLSELHKMEQVMQLVFPWKNAFGIYEKHDIDPEKLMLALRHGKMGIETVLAHFSFNTNLLMDKTNGRIPHNKLPKNIWYFLKNLKRNYKNETSKTKVFIHEFIKKLNQNYALVPKSGLNKKPQKSFYFIRSRVLSMIQTFKESLAPTA